MPIRVQLLHLSDDAEAKLLAWCAVQGLWLDSTLLAEDKEEA